MISRDQVIHAFLDKLSEYGIALTHPDRIELDGNWHRAHVDGDRGRAENLSYRIYYDDRPAGFFEDHKRGVTGTFSVTNGEDQSPAEREAAQARWKAAQQARAAEQELRYQEAAKRAQRAIQAASGGDPAAHPYAVRKGITPGSSVKVDGDLLLIPVYTDFGVISSYQSISAEGEKLFMPGGRMAGAFHPIIGERKDKVLVCEGYATGASLVAATGYSTACAMSAGNFAAVVRKMQAKFPEREVVACPDNDHGTLERTGRNPGLDAAADLGVRIVAPAFPVEADPKHTDWDDWLRGYGTAEQLLAMVDDPPNEPEPPTTTQPDDEPPFAPDSPRDPEPARRPRHAEQVVDLPPATESKAYNTIANWASLGLELSDKGVPHPNLDNAAALLERHPAMQGQFWYDEFLQRILSTWNIEHTPREWTDADDVRLALWMQRAMKIGRMAVGTARDAVTAIAMAHARNECREWLESLNWDGTHRLESLIPTAFGAEDNAYTRAVGRCWLVSMVARVMQPGCKVDTMPVFEGKQGRGKSTALQVLVGSRWFAEASESPTSKDFFQALQGKMLVEIGEMDAFSRSEVHTIKRVLSCQTDRYRAPYGRRAEDHPRMGVLAGTTNKDDWNRDETGARRLWPIACSEVDLDWLRSNRAQLFAEAVACYVAGESWWDVPQADAEQQQEARRSADEWERVIDTWLTGKWETTIGEVLSGALKVDADKWDKGIQMRVATCLKVLRWERTTVRRGNTTIKVWRPEGGNGGNEILL